MLSYLIRRVLYTLPSLFGVLLACFVLTRLSGDPTELFLPMDATEEARAAFRVESGLDRPLVEQFLRFTERAVRGDFGDSLRFREPALNLLVERLPATLELAVATLLIAVLLGVPLYSNAAGILPLVDALYAKGLPMGTLLAFMMATVALSLPEMILLRRVLKPRLIATFALVTGLGIVAVGYLFNAIL